MNMKRCWYVKIGEQEEGPYSIEELKGDLRITQNTLVWKKGFSSWVPLSMVPELFEALFGAEKEEIEFKELSQEELALTLQAQAPFFAFWLLLVIGILIFVLFVLFWD